MITRGVYQIDFVLLAMFYDILRRINIRNK